MKRPRSQKKKRSRGQDVHGEVERSRVPYMNGCRGQSRKRSRGQKVHEEVKRSRGESMKS